MKHFLIALLLTSILFASCEKEVIVIIEEEEILIDSIDIIRFMDANFDNYQLLITGLTPWNDFRYYQFLFLSDSARMYLRVKLLDSDMEAKLFLIEYLQNISAGFLPGTEDMEPLGNEYWWHSTKRDIKVTSVMLRRHNAVLSISFHPANNIMPFAQMLDQAIIDKEDFVYFRESQE